MEDWKDRIQKFLLAFYKDQPELSLAILVVVMAVLLVFFFRFLRKHRRRGQSHDFLCRRRRIAVLDGIHSYYLSNPKTVTEADVDLLLQTSLIKKRDSSCPSGYKFSLSSERSPKGKLKDAWVRCRKHGESRLGDSYLT